MHKIIRPDFWMCLPDPPCSAQVNVAGHQGFLEMKDFFQKRVCWPVKEGLTEV